MSLAQKLLDCIKSNSSYECIRDMDKEGQLEILMPIIKDMKSVGECKYHVVNCFEHSLLALKTFEEILNTDNFFESHLSNEIHKNLNEQLDDGLTKKDILKLGILLHDIGKPEAKTIDNTGRVRFRRHETIGADKIFSIGKLLNLNDRNVSILYKYVDGPSLLPVNLSQIPVIVNLFIFPTNVISFSTIVSKASSSKSKKSVSFTSNISIFP